MTPILTKDDVLCIIISYEDSTLTDRAANSAVNQVDIPIKVCVWDNSVKDFYTPSNPKIHCVRSPAGNILWSPAVNAAINHFYSGEKYLLVMNHDVQLPPGAVSSMVSLARCEEVGLVGPLGRFADGIQDYARRFPGLRGFANDLGALNDLTKELSPIRASWLQGACLLMRKEVYDLVGPYDEMMPLGLDDKDYSIRVKKHGYQLVVDQSVVIDHKVRASAKDPNWDKWVPIGMKVFEEKWAGYYSEEEIGKCLWNDGTYYEGYDK